MAANPRARHGRRAEALGFSTDLRSPLAWALGQQQTLRSSWLAARNSSPMSRQHPARRRALRLLSAGKAIGLRRAVAAAALAVVLTQFAGCAPGPSPPEGTPRLILFIVIDQGRYDYLERFRPLLTSGLARLLDESVVFTNANHDHAITTTAPGHATLSTGRYPSRHGIINNWWFDRGKEERVAAVGSPPSPKAMLASTLGDWLKAKYSRSKVFVAAGKDRAAVLTAGKDADGAYWPDSSKGKFIGSRFYQMRDPGWMRAYHKNLYPMRYFGQAWEALPEVTAVTKTVEMVEAAEDAEESEDIETTEQEPDYGIRQLDSGTIERQFPHAIGSASPQPTSSFYSALLNDTPFGDAYLADFAQALIKAEALGADAYPDLLGLGFSALDKVGHTYGPDSPELLDTLLRLDRTLGEVLDFVDRHIGLEHTLVSLSSDHGVTPLPEILAGKGIDARRLGAEATQCFQHAREALRQRFGEHEWFMSGFSLDRELVEDLAVDPAEIERETRRLIEACTGVERVWTRSELDSGKLSGDPIQRLYAHSFHPERSPDLLVQFEPHTLRLFSSNATTHGTPYPYDTHVPWLLRLPSGATARVDEPVFTVDVAPTLAHLVGVAPPADLDGVDRRSLLPTRP